MTEEVTVQIPKEAIQNEILRAIAERAISDSIVNAISNNLSNWNIKKAVEDALAAAIRETVFKYVSSDKTIQSKIHTVVKDMVTDELINKTSQDVVSKLTRSY